MHAYCKRSCDACDAGRQLSLADEYDDVTTMEFLPEFGMPESPPPPAEDSEIDDEVISTAVRRGLWSHFILALMGLQLVLAGH